MADITQGASAPAATIPTAAPQAAIEVSTPVQTIAPPPVATPPAAPATPSPAPEATPVAVKSESLLGAEPTKAAEAAPVDPAAPAEVKKDAPAEPAKEEAAPAEAVVPKFESFKLPEGVTLEDSGLNDFTKELVEFETATKADHAKLQEFGQKLVDRHVAEVQNVVQRLNDHYKTAWDKQRNDWKESFEKDPEIGGNRRETTLNAALQFIRTHGGDEKQQQEFRSLMDTTGVGNHPALIRILAKAMTVMGEGKPLPGAKPVLPAQGKASRRYSGTAAN